jgi:DNA repair exonuclease SbcCD nuclease subunit
MRFVHTSDWHVGKTFAFAEEAAQSLRDERLDAIARVGASAVAHGASHVLVAGDVYDVETPSERTLRQPIERMRGFESLTWHVIPGNHDPHTPRGPWERLSRMAQRSELPPNIRVHLTAQPVCISENAYLLPAVLTRRHASGDPTGWMDEAPTPDGALRIGLAHGSVLNFGTDAADTPNRIAPDRARSAGLGYLALGDRHGQLRINDLVWYAGTPETDDFAGTDGGHALLIDLAEPAAPPMVTRLRTGRFSWKRAEETLHSAADVDILDARLRAMSPDLATTLLWLRVSGALSLDARAQYESRVREALGSAFRVLRLDDAALVPQPTQADLAAIDHAGFVRTAADRLAALAAAPDNPKRDLAAAALQRLFVLARQAGNPPSA